MRRITSANQHSYAHRLAIACILSLTGLLPILAHADEPTSVMIDGQTYGAQADEVGPIGGGEGYTRIVTEGDLVAKDLDELLDALAKAKSGQTIFIPGKTEIDCTARIYIEDLVVEIPGGVTLAGNRGQDGSAGALIYSDAIDTKPLIRIMGPEARITGLRVRGPSPKRYLDHYHRSFVEKLPNGKRRGHDYYYKLPYSRGIVTEHPGLEVDNCEISGFSHTGIFLDKGDDHHIHHNFIHHCQYQGLGYGVVHNVSMSLIERNLFDWNRHSIAGRGWSDSGYVARHNVELGTSLAHCFDMHGKTVKGQRIAGTTIRIHNNTFRSPATPMYIRGAPEKGCEVFRNWFPRHANPKQAVLHGKKTVVRDNAYGHKSPKVIP